MIVEPPSRMPPPRNCAMRRPDEAAEVDAPVAVEAPILDRHDRLGEMRRQAGRGELLAPEAAAGGEDAGRIGLDGDRPLAGLDHGAAERRQGQKGGEQEQRERQDREQDHRGGDKQGGAPAEASEGRPPPAARGRRSRPAGSDRPVRPEGSRALGPEARPRLPEAVRPGGRCRARRRRSGSGGDAGGRAEARPALPGGEARDPGARWPASASSGSARRPGRAPARRASSRAGSGTGRSGRG